ncbi:MAG TPA: ABC transporter ATP-binding protein [Baekduia sp.]|uniref:ABC transporter ATP-binding protein n=1 Tax=Baekduia sp. TaxID=2600305 RepID=UPI002C8C580A|nr:ABC transporter ATP-binding protein [Baekduia sp.]HMJ35037.1 ABC transporter ATP-binding protein [Baekduia sp.]
MGEVAGPGPRSAPVLAAEDVSVRFGGVTALEGVSLDVVPGVVCGLIGPNGSGKTTLFDVLSGIRAPTSGTVRLHRRDVTRRSAAWRSRHGIRRTFQRQQMFGWLSVEDNVLLALEWRGGGGGMVGDLLALPTRRRLERERRAQTGAVLEACGLHAARHVPAGRLPIGRARMVEMARAIVDPPKVLLLDEPTSGLERGDVEILGRTIQAMRVDHDCAVLLVEHDVGFAMAHCDRMVVLDLGRVIAEGPPDEIRTNRAVRTAYLG